MYIHRLGKSTSSGSSTLSNKGRTLEGTYNQVARNMKRITGSELNKEIFKEGEGIASKPTNILRKLKTLKPRVPKKYITFE